MKGFGVQSSGFREPDMNLACRLTFALVVACLAGTFVSGMLEAEAPAQARLGRTRPEPAMELPRLVTAPVAA